MAILPALAIYHINGFLYYGHYYSETWCCRKSQHLDTGSLPACNRLKNV